MICHASRLDRIQTARQAHGLQAAPPEPATVDQPGPQLCPPDCVPVERGWLWIWAGVTVLLVASLVASLARPEP